MKICPITGNKCREHKCARFYPIRIGGLCSSLHTAKTLDTIAKAVKEVNKNVIALREVKPNE